MEEYVLLKLSSFLCWAGLVSINLLSFVMKIWLTRFPVLACVQGRDGNTVSPDAVGGVVDSCNMYSTLPPWLGDDCIPKIFSQRPPLLSLLMVTLLYSSVYHAHNNKQPIQHMHAYNFTLLEPHICAELMRISVFFIPTHPIQVFSPSSHLKASNRLFFP